MSDPASLSAAKRALLERELLRRRRQAAAPEIPRRAGHGPAPLSFSQQRMWFLDRWEPGSPTFNGARALRLRGPLDRAALQAGLTRIVERHESLRTVFAGEHDPVQVALQEWSLALAVLPAPAGGDAQALAELLSELAREPFDLRRDLMLRASLIELGPEDHVLLLRMHHIAADAHSDGILFGELSELYAAALEGRPARLPALAIQYADFAVWQRERLTGKVLEDLIAYWRGQLQGAPELLALPTDRPRPPIQRHVGAHLPVALERALGDALLELSRAEGVTFYITMLAAFATLLYRISGEADIVIGSPIANRNHVELQGLIGFFTNTIALRVPLAGNPSFREVIARARAAALGAYAHQDLPFEKVVEALSPRRTPSHNPVFQVNFRAQAAPRPVPVLSGLEVLPLTVDIGFSRFDLALELELGAESLAGYFEHDRDLFDEGTVERFRTALGALLAQVSADPDLPVLAVKLDLGGTARTAAGTIARRRRS